MTSWLLVSFALKLLLTAGIVVTASVIVERSGPLIGSIIVALPTSVGAAYIIMAIEHPPAFIAQSTIASAVGNTSGALFCLAYAYTAQRFGVVLSLLAAIATWLGWAVAMQQFSWTIAGAFWLNIAVFCVTIPALWPLRNARAPAGRALPTRQDLAVRVLIVGLFVAGVTTASHQIGSAASGLFVIFPVAMISFMAILQPRIGGPAAGAVLAQAQIPLLAQPFLFSTVNLLAEPVGVWWAYLAGLSVSLGWSLVLLRFKSSA
jgi:hypothetical protein